MPFLVVGFGAARDQKSKQALCRKFQAGRQWHAPIQKARLLFLGKALNVLQVFLDGLVKGLVHFGEGGPLDRDVEIEADRFPLAAATLRVAAQDLLHWEFLIQREAHAARSPLSVDDMCNRGAGAIRRRDSGQRPNTLR